MREAAHGTMSAHAHEPAAREGLVQELGQAERERDA